ncbi:LysE family transporter [Candidatus Venteria ishoeyi]|uniref:LysE family translocator n=1 Tax=Candidatus Venteria ishoeyi TaxID=1899563 RepID=UPI0025A4DC81|nr:LysE family transporter [Candidatus Venteria ishoeyi]MDM8547532.1 LysE family transporter [Candidatus Venteria ishoeyi]
MFYYLTFGIILGLSAGFAPGPLLTLVISETLEHDTKAGIKVALAPIITDLPIIILTLYVFAQLSRFHKLLGTVSLIGGCFVLLMAYDSIREKGNVLNLQAATPKSLSKGILANALSPHPYLFWLSVGAPTMAKALSLNIFAPLLFMSGFYTFLVGSKVLLAIFVGKSKTFLSGNIYRYTIRFLGLVLGILAFALFIDGLKLLGILTV